MTLEISVVMVMMGNFDLPPIHSKVVLPTEAMTGGPHPMSSRAWSPPCPTGSRMWSRSTIVVCGRTIRTVITTWTNVEQETARAILHRNKVWRS